MRIRPPPLWTLVSLLVSSFLLVTIWQATPVEGQTNDQNFKRRTSNLCNRDVDCPDNAFCKISGGIGYCSCKDGYLITNYNATHRECVKEASNLGDVCKVNIQCQSRLSVNAICQDGVCICKEGTHLDGGRCYETAIIGQSCQTTHNCYLGPEDSISNEAYCVKGICTCSLLHSPRDGGTRCIKDADLGDPCEDDQHCTGANTRCHGVCRCLEGYVAHDEDKRCLKEAVSLGDPCEIESQCTSHLNNTTCMDQECVCNWGFHNVNDSCWITKYNGMRCIHNQECVDAETTLLGLCINGVCSCSGCGDSSALSSSSPTETNTIKLIFLSIGVLLYLKY